MSGSKVPVLVFGVGLTGTAVLRALARARIPSYAVADCPDFMSKSRWYRTVPGAGESCPKPSELGRFLESLPIEKAVLMPCADDWAKAVASVSGPISQRFPASVPCSCVIETMIDKWAFAEMLKREGLPHPTTLLLHDMQEVKDLPDSEYEGKFIKPRGSLEFLRKYRVKAFLVKDKADAVSITSQLHVNGTTEFPLMLQEYIPGPATNHYFVDGFVNRFGKVCALFARQRLRMFPPYFGNSTLMESVPLEQVSGAIATLDHIWQVLKYRGIFSAEFKYDDRDGQFKILEINARPWWYLEFAERCGVNVCEFAYKDALGIPLEPIQKYKVGRRCVYLPNDFYNLRAARKSGDYGFFGWVESWIGAEEAVFAWDDPLPGLVHMSHLVKRYLMKGARG